MDSESNQKIHRQLDGETGLGEFSPEEQRDIEFQNRIILETQKIHRSIKVPDLTHAVMARVSANPAGQAVSARRWGMRSLLSWMWSPRMFQARPAYALAIVLVVILSFMVGQRWMPQGGSPVTLSPQVAKIFIQFRIEAPQASAVHLGGSFTEWEPSYTLHQLSPGIWSVLVPLDPGVYDYAFLVNGQWVTDPAAPVVDDGFGGQNSRLLVVVPNGPASL